ncbi:MAG: transcriptional regulator NrdR [Planctomycetota bacterium]
MRCPFCEIDDDRVIDTRPAEGGLQVRRRRLCNSCGKRFTTVEMMEKAEIRVIKDDNNREPFDREKVRRGIERACSKRNIASDRIEQLVQRIEADIDHRNLTEIHSKEIGRLVMERLIDFDPVAYVRFASVYREFDSVDHFIATIGKLAPLK